MATLLPLLSDSNGPSVWPILEARVCAKRRRSLEPLKESLLRLWNRLSPDDLQSIAESFITRLDLCIPPRGPLQIRTDILLPSVYIVIINESFYEVVSCFIVITKKLLQVLENPVISLLLGGMEGILQNFLP